MSRSTVKEQIREIESAVGEFPEYLDLLKLSKDVLKILIPVDESATKGARDAISDETLKNLKEKAEALRRPISSFLDPAIFDEGKVSRIVSEIGEYLMRNRPQGAPLRRFLTALRTGAVDASEAVKAILEENAEWLQRLGEKYGVEPSLLLFLFETPLRPFFEDVARRVNDELIESWWELFCPVCGRTSIVARIRQRKRYMTCIYCGAEYLVDLFLCVNCGNNEPTSLGFITFEEHPEYELNYCEKCNHYIKSIYEERLRRKIPNGLEDLLTQELDVLADGQELGLKRT